MDHLLEKFTLDELERYNMVELPDHIISSYREMEEEVDYNDDVIEELQSDVDYWRAEAGESEERMRELEKQLEERKLTLVKE